MTGTALSKDGPKGPRCPMCQAPAEHAHRPFCSRRCCDLDLARWLGGGYVIASAPDETDEDGDVPAAGAATGDQPDE